MMDDIYVVKNYINEKLANDLFFYLRDNITWHNRLVNQQAETIKIKRKMAYVADLGVGVYSYASLSFPAESWNQPLEDLRVILSDSLAKPFNSVLLNYYENGRDQISWHADKEPSLGEKPVIACVNLGATRKFWYREIAPNSEKNFHLVGNGDLIVMGENCQKKYLHAILKEPIDEPRISLTYRFNFPDKSS